mgnify:CR=1 FL=1
MKYKKWCWKLILIALVLSVLLLVLMLFNGIQSTLVNLELRENNQRIENYLNNIRPVAELLLH